MGSRKATCAVAASVIILAGLALLGPFMYRWIRSEASRPNVTEEAGEEFVPLTHDQLLGPPLSFETPAYLRIPAIGVEEEVREGSDDEEELYELLALGPIHLPHTGYPGWPGNCVISGHRTTHTRPFNRLDELAEGDVIYVQNPRGLYEYRVYDVFYIKPWENVTLATEEPILTLTTCAPEGDASLRLVVRASLQGFVPVEEMEP